MKPKIIYQNKILEVPVNVVVPGPVVYIYPSDLERGEIAIPNIIGSTWQDGLVLIADYNNALMQCNARIRRIWLDVDNHLGE